MTPFRRIALALCFFVVTSGLPLLAEESWTEVRSPNFDIITDAGEKRGREAALRFEQMRAAFDHIFNVKISTPIPLQIVAFRSDKELRRVAPLWKGKPIELAGLYIPGEDREFIALELTSAAGYETAFHEYTHLLLQATVGELPLWMNEGLAEYLSTIKLEKNRIVYGQVPNGEGYVLQNNKWMKVEQLFAVQHDSPEYNERGNHRSVFYAESWLMVHYLMSNDTLAKAFAYRQLVQQGHVSVPDAIDQAFGMSPAQLDNALGGYARHGLAQFSVPGTQVAAEETYTSKPISGIDAEAIVADLHLHEPDYTQQSVTEFQQVLKQQPDNAIAHRGLGYALLQSGDFAGAEQHLKAAAATNAADARTHYLYALLLTRVGPGATKSTVVISDKADVDVVALKKEAQAAIALDPNFADAYNLLAYAQARDHDFQSALASETKAFQLNKSKDIYLLNLAQYQAQTHNLDEAERLLKALVNSHDQFVVMNAQNYLMMIQTERNFEAAHRAQAASPPTQSFQPTTDSDSTVRTIAPEPSGSVQFLKGKIVKVDCSSPPGATVGVMVGNKLWAMTTSDRNRLVIIGADTFSCDWRNRNVAVNLRVKGNYTGEMVSLELQ